MIHPTAARPPRPADPTPGISSIASTYLYALRGRIRPRALGGSGRLLHAHPLPDALRPGRVQRANHDERDQGDGEQDPPHGDASISSLNFIAAGVIHPPMPRTERRAGRCTCPRRAHGRSERPPVVSILLAFRGLVRALTAVWRDPETKALPFVAGALVLTGTIFYWRFEDSSFIQSLYFAVVTLTTVGYGDLHPTSDETRIFTIVYILTGLGVLVPLLSAIAQNYITLKTEGGHMRERLGVLPTYVVNAADRGPVPDRAVGSARVL
jgi:voltage-gated potassium channel